MEGLVEEKDESPIYKHPIQEVKSEDKDSAAAAPDRAEMYRQMEDRF
jgi:hypothetical protein